MPGDVSLEARLRARLALAESEAPPPPRAATLLQTLRPWWERDPAQFRVRVTRLRRMPATVGFAMSAPERSRDGGVVPALIVASHDTETYLRMLYVAVQQSRLRLRFAVDVDGMPPHPAFDVTFVADASDVALFSTDATRSQSGEYRIDVALPNEVAVLWAALRVTDRMPFPSHPASAAGHHAADGQRIVSFLWFWSFWHWSAEGVVDGVLLRGPLHGIAGHWDEWYRHAATPDEIDAIDAISADPAQQRAFIHWVVRHFAPRAIWQGEPASARFIFGQLATLTPFDGWSALTAFHDSYGLRGVSSIVLAEGSVGEAGDVRHTEALAIGRDPAARDRSVIAEGFSASSLQLDTARAAVESLLTGRGFVALAWAWTLGGRRPYGRRLAAMMAMGWAVLCVALLVLLFGPDPGDALVRCVAVIALLWLALLLVELLTVLVVLAMAWRDARQLRAHLDRSELHVRMPGGLRLLGGSAGLPLALNMLLAVHRAAPRASRTAWLWTRIFRALRTDAARWAATGGVDAAGRVLPVVLEPKLRASLRHGRVLEILMPRQRGAPRAMPVLEGAAAPGRPSVARDVQADATPLHGHRCRHLADAVLAVARVQSGRQAWVGRVAFALSAVMLVALPDMRAILAPAPGPMIVGPLSTTPYDIVVSLDGARSHEFWVVLESGFWYNRRVPVLPAPDRLGGPPRAALPLQRARRQGFYTVDDGTVWIERRQRLLFREFDPGERVGRFTLSYLMARHD